MDVQEVDESDAAWVDRASRFRIYLQGPPTPDVTYATRTYDLTDCDIVQAIDWAQRHAGEDLVYSIAIVFDDPSEPATQRRGLIWILGEDANEAGDDSEQLARMFARRVDQVSVPPLDRAP